MRDLLVGKYFLQVALFKRVSFIVMSVVSGTCRVFRNHKWIYPQDCLHSPDSEALADALLSLCHTTDISFFRFSELSCTDSPKHSAILLVTDAFHSAALINTRPCHSVSLSGLKITRSTVLYPHLGLFDAIALITTSKDWPAQLIIDFSKLSNGLWSYPCSHTLPPFLPSMSQHLLPL